MRPQFYDYSKFAHPCISFAGQYHAGVVVRVGVGVVGVCGGIGLWWLSSECLNHQTDNTGQDMLPSQTRLKFYLHIHSSTAFPENVHKLVKRKI